MKKFSKLLALLLVTQLILVCGNRIKSVHAAANPSEKINSNYSTVNEKIKEKANTLVEKYGVTSVQYAMMDDGNIISSGNSGVYSKNNNRSITSDTMYGIRLMII